MLARSPLLVLLACAVMAACADEQPSSSTAVDPEQRSGASGDSPSPAWPTTSKRAEDERHESTNTDVPSTADGATGDGLPVDEDDAAEESTAPLAMPSVDALPRVDLSDSDEAPWLGMRVRDARPRLTHRCVSDHYAERLAPYYLRLSCLTDVADPDVSGRRIRFGVLEGPHGSDVPTRLAYHIETLEVAPERLAAVFDAHLRAAEARFGVAHDDAGPPPPASGSRLSWQGVGRDDRPTTFELSVEAGADTSLSVVSAYRDVRLSNALFDR